MAEPQCATALSRNISSIYLYSSPIEPLLVYFVLGIGCGSIYKGNAMSSRDVSSINKIFKISQGLNNPAYLVEVYFRYTIFGYSMTCLAEPLSNINLELICAVF